MVRPCGELTERGTQGYSCRDPDRGIAVRTGSRASGPCKGTDMKEEQEEEGEEQTKEKKERRAQRPRG